MMLLKRLYTMNSLKKVNAIQTIDTSDLVIKADYNTKIEDIKKKLLIMINTLLLMNLIS